MFKLITLTSGEMNAMRGLWCMFIFCYEKTDRTETERQMEENGQVGWKWGLYVWLWTTMSLLCHTWWRKWKPMPKKKGKRQTEGGTGAMLLEWSNLCGRNRFRKKVSVQWNALTGFSGGKFWLFYTWQAIFSFFMRFPELKFPAW